MPITNIMDQSFELMKRTGESDANNLNTSWHFLENLKTHAFQRAVWLVSAWKQAELGMLSTQPAVHRVMLGKGQSLFLL